MIHREHDRSVGCAVAFQFVRDQTKRNLSLPFQELAKEALRPKAVASRLDEDVDHVTVLVHGAPKVLPFTVDPDENFVEEPCISKPTLASLQTPDILETELPAPPSDCLLGHYDSPFGKQVLDISETDTESVVEPDGGRVEPWRGGPQATPWLCPAFPPSCPFRIRRGSVSSARHVARSMRISRTTRSCTLRLKGYETYR